MNVFVYQAALLCATCGEAIRKRLAIAAPDRFDSESSDLSPQGPVANGGGEADSPQHCDACNLFLENPLTGDGYLYVAEQIDNYANGRGNLDVLQEWAEFYRGEHPELDAAIDRANW